MMSFSSCSVSASEYLSGKEIVPVTKSLRPGGVKSVYEIPEEEGGRSRARDQMRQMGNQNDTSAGGDAASGGGKAQILSEGPLMMANEGLLWTSWQQVYASIQGKTMYVFPNKDAAVPLLSIALDVKTDTGLARTHPEEAFQLEIALCQGGKLVGRKNFKTTSSVERNSWVMSVNQAQEHALVLANSQSSTSSSSSVSAAPQQDETDADEPAAAVDYHLKGYLLKYTEGYFWNSWQRQYAFSSFVIHPTPEKRFSHSLCFPF